MLGFAATRDPGPGVVAAPREPVHGPTSFRHAGRSRCAQSASARVRDRARHACRSSSVRAPSIGPSCRGPRHAHRPLPVPPARPDIAVIATAGLQHSSAGSHPRPGASSHAAVFSHARLNAASRQPRALSILACSSLYAAGMMTSQTPPGCGAPTRRDARSRSRPRCPRDRPGTCDHGDPQAPVGQHPSAGVHGHQWLRPRAAASAAGCWRSRSGGARRPRIACERAMRDPRAPVR